MTTARVHSFESFGSVDGPGVRFVVFLQGCKMRCRYCHNPDTWDFVGLSEEKTPQEILSKALRYRDYWGNQGGITVSGGEPLLQSDFLIEFFSLAKAQGIHTAIDTAGSTYEENPDFLESFSRLMQVTDLVLLDIKHIDETTHKRLTGVSNKATLACARYLEKIGKPVWLRHVLVPGWTDDETDLTHLAQYASTLTNVERIDILPFHNFATFKWEKLGIKYTLKNVASPSKKSIEKAKSIFSQACHCPVF